MKKEKRGKQICRYMWRGGLAGFCFFYKSHQMALNSGSIGLSENQWLDFFISEFIGFSNLLEVICGDLRVFDGAMGIYLGDFINK